ncbi:MAG TPA: hypothetical protein DCE71_03650 [Parachlamydiales bacterium]|nr:hypothetical protein [Parachlamydiales bacterium]
MSSIGSSGFDEGRREVSKEELNFFKDAFCKKESSLGRLRSFDVETKTKSVAGRLFKRSDISNDKKLYEYALKMIGDRNVTDHLETKEYTLLQKHMQMLLTEIEKNDPFYVSELVSKMMGKKFVEEFDEETEDFLNEIAKEPFYEGRKTRDEAAKLFPNEREEWVQKQRELHQEKQERHEEKAKVEFNIFLRKVQREDFFVKGQTEEEARKVPPHERETWIEEKRAEYKREQEGNRKDVEAEAIQLLKQRHGIGQMTFKSNSDVFLFIERELGIKKTDPRMQLIIVEIFHKAPSASSRTPSLDELLSGNKKFPEHVKDVIVEIAANKEFNNKYLKKLSSQLNEVLRKNIEPNVLQGRDPLFCIEEGLIRFPESLIVRLGNVDEVKHRNSELLHYIDEQFDSTETVLEGIFPDKQESEIRNGLKTGRLAFPREITKEYLNENYRVWKKEDR